MNAPIDLSSLRAQPEGQTHGGQPQVLSSSPSGGAVQVGDAALLTGGDYQRLGPDLLITGETGQQVLITDFFRTETPPSLQSANGAVIPGDLAVKLAGSMAPGMLAQAGAGTAKQAIGRVETTNGSVNVVHADGAKGVLQKGDPVFQGDVLQTAKGAAVGLVFLDDTTLSLGGNGRMVLDQMVFDPATHSGKSAFSLVQGSFSFVSGQIAKASPDAMAIRTPVATIGIRGTLGTGGYTPEGGLTVALMPEGGGTVGEIVLSNSGGSQVLNQPGFATQVLTFFTSPPPPVVLTPAQVQANFGQALQSLPPPINNPGAVNAVQEIQQQAVSQGVAPGTGGQGAAQIVVQQTVGAQQLAQHLAQQQLINQAIQNGQSVGNAQQGAQQGQNQQGGETGTGQVGLGNVFAPQPPGPDPLGGSLFDPPGGETGPGGGTIGGGIGGGGETGPIDWFIDIITDDGGDDEGDDDDDDLIGDLIDDLLDDDGDGSHVKIGLLGNDTLTGGAGNTAFIYVYDSSLPLLSAMNGNDVIEDAGGEDDQLVLTDLEDVRIKLSDDSLGDGYLNVLFEKQMFTGGPYQLGDITLSTEVESIFAAGSDFADGVLLTNALKPMAEGGLEGDSVGYAYIIVGTSAGDSIDVSAETDLKFSLLVGEAGADTIYGGVNSQDIIFGGADGDTLYGYGGSDSLYGGDGDDWLRPDESGAAGYGNDSIDGGAGIDRLDYSTFSDGVTINVASGYSTLTYSSTIYTDHFANMEIYAGTNVDDSFLGGSGDDTFFGGTGNDTITGGNGCDFLEGGAGAADWLSFENESGGSGAFADLGNNMFTDTWGNSDVATGFENLIGSVYNDQMFGNAGDNTFIGGLGDDQITGNGGSDWVSYVGNTAAVTVNLDSSDHGGALAGKAASSYSGVDTLSGIEGVIGTVYADTIYGQSAMGSSIFGGKGDDYIELSTAVQSDEVHFYGGDTSQGAGTIGRVSTLGTDTVINFKTTSDALYLSDKDFGLGTSGLLAAGTSYFDDGGSGYGSQTAAITALATGTNNACVFVVGTNSAGQALAVYYLAANASSAAESYQIATVTASDAGLSAGLFHLDNS